MKYGFFARLKEKIIRFMYGRYGMDKLGFAIVVVSMVMSFTSSLMGKNAPVASYILWALSYVLLILALWRILSKNIYARRRENEKYLAFGKPVLKWFKLQYNRIKDIKTHRYFSCPNCKNNLRVPKGRGDITITCPVCKTKFDRKT